MTEATGRQVLFPVALERWSRLSLRAVGVVAVAYLAWVASAWGLSSTAPDHHGVITTVLTVFALLAAITAIILTMVLALLGFVLVGTAAANVVTGLVIRVPWRELGRWLAITAAAAVATYGLIYAFELSVRLTGSLAGGQ